jgi:hypothetical protein
VERDERDQRDRAEALDRQWDALLRGGATSATADLDADLVTLVARLHAAGRAIPPLFPDPNQAWRELRQSATPATLSWSDEETAPPAWPYPNGHVDLFPPRRLETSPPRRRGRWVLTQLATAALLLLTLAAGFAAIRQHPPEAPDEGRWVPALVRALEAAPGDIEDTPLIEASFSPEELPGGEKEATYYRLVFSPGASLPYLGSVFCGCRSETITAGVGVEVVQTGVYTLRLEAPLRVQRAGSSHPSEEIPAGREVTLAAGDAVIYPDYAAPGDIRNAGNEPVTIIGVSITATEGSGTRLRQLPPEVRASLLTHSVARDWEAFAPGPLNVALRQVTLPPESSIGPYAPVGLQAMWIESGAIARNFLPVGETTPRGKPLTHVAGNTIPFVRPSSGVRELLTSTGKEPADLLVLIIEPAVSSVQSLAP